MHLLCSGTVICSLGKADCRHIQRQQGTLPSLRWPLFLASPDITYHYSRVKHPEIHHCPTVALLGQSAKIKDWITATDILPLCAATAE